MNKKILFTLSLLSILVFLISCGGGGGGGSLTTPPGTNTGVPSVLKLLDVQNVAQTNTTIYMKAKVLDGNGKPVAGQTVYFTKISGVGTLNAASSDTDTTGVATVTLNSAVPGFSSIMAEVTGAAGQMRNVNSVYFTSSLSMSLRPIMLLDVDGNDSNTIYNEPGDYNLFEASVANDTQVTIRATVFNSIGLLVFGETVTFGADFPYKIGSDPAAPCSDGSTSCEVSFPLGNTATTNFNGEAFVLVQVTPTLLRNITTVLNITAIADNGAFNMGSLFLNPVTVNSGVVRATPTTIESDGESEISATVTTNTGGPVPDGTAVNFTSTAGVLSTPFAQTESGVAKTTLTAPTVTSDINITVTASVGGKSGTVSVAVTAPAVEPPTPVALTIVPGTVSILASSGGSQTFTITGGTGPYITTSSDPANAYDTAVGDGVWTGSSIKVNVPAGATPGNVTITVNDSVGATKTATIKIVASAPALPLSSIPASQSVSCSSSTGVTFLISGGIGPYTATSLNTGVLTTTPASPLAFTGTFDAVPTGCTALPPSTPVSVVVSDSVSPTPNQITLTVTVTNP